ncbi:preprotein translocase subunit SecG [Myxococcus sp. MISCRS1]|jgi:preprotein translocase subunit SecG|uniref:Protein-export membrane protein SecG n=1 Tax=Myxococcus fulvus TaxID=33 RepID=A0A511T644_MYXFU|nr:MULTISPECIES: preprotein translocase subunit SecG [Myxococcus]AKF81072.1 preprotein translocase subunit SecG [Myxococcus fulvus 124B02]BDT33740.1 preprotein translocase subunit SecG [Myxococcus sp. MH1]MBZ4396634.1 preprotein translocase subunit SecG [Myxococcus sp. AS-1-15]MBZ4408641.1 preprotein translocase subunit SecG [Myxococcus sp. XM-1-1-1]MCK8496588.1 preprotein translocase subunit SecG [Myxococcus fulvus]
MLTFVTIVHVLVCVFMIFVILLQPGKDAGMGSALGGGAATSAFGGRGAVTFLSKLTGVCAAMFFFTSLGLSFVGLKSSVAAGGSIAAPAPAAPAAPAPAAGETSSPAGQQAAPGTVEQPRGEAAPAEGQQAPAPTPAP